MDAGNYSYYKQRYGHWPGHLVAFAGGMLEAIAKKKAPEACELKPYSGACPNMSNEQVSEMSFMQWACGGETDLKCFWAEEVAERLAGDAEKEEGDTNGRDN